MIWTPWSRSPVVHLPGLLDNIDLTNTGFNKAFQPQVSYNNGSVNFSASWWMEFEVTFLNKNTSTVATVNNFQVTAIDIDGDGGNLRKPMLSWGFTSYTVENNSLLTVSNVMNGSTVIGKQFTGCSLPTTGSTPPKRR